MALNQKQSLFVEEYLKTGLVTASYLAAGYPASGTNSDNVKASKLLSSTKVKAVIDAKKAELAKLSLWSREDSVRELKKVVTTAKFNGDIVSAVKVLNQMCGYDAPLKIEHSGAISLIKRVLVDPKDPS